MSNSDGVGMDDGAGAGAGAGTARVSLRECLTALTPEQVVFVDRALAEIGAFGEIRILKKNGRVRFIETLESRDLSKVEHGDGRVR